MASSRSKIVSAVLWTGKASVGIMLVTKPDDEAAWKKERLVKVWEGTSQNQWSNVVNPLASVEMTGICSGV